MRTPLQPLVFNIDFMPEMTHPLVGVFIDPDLDLSEGHVACIQDAIHIAQEMMFKENRDE